MNYKQILCCGLFISSLFTVDGRLTEYREQSGKNHLKTISIGVLSGVAAYYSIYPLMAEFIQDPNFIAMKAPLSLSAGILNFLLFELAESFSQTLPAAQIRKADHFLDYVAEQTITQIILKNDKNRDTLRNQLLEKYKDEEFPFVEAAFDLMVLTDNLSAAKKVVTEIALKDIKAEDVELHVTVLEDVTEYFKIMEQTIKLIINDNKFTQDLQKMYRAKKTSDMQKANWVAQQSKKY